MPDWVEAEFRLPERSSAQPGRFNLWRYQRGWLEAIGDPLTPRVTLMKAARLGFSKCLIATIGSYACNDPCSVILLVPTEDDARRYAVDEVEPSFDESPALHDLISRGRLDGRNTLVTKAFSSGGSLKILAARAPRNLRMHDAKVLLIDEADAMDVTIEGDPILLAEKRTVAHPDRKIVCGSTPTTEDTSVVARRFEESTQEVFEVPCPECWEFNEIEWSNIEWESGAPETAKYMCPHCKELIDERNKQTMVNNGRWRALKPDVVGHRGFRINALVSLLPNASWGQLAREYVEAKRGGPHMMQVFHNTVLAKPWRTTINRVDASMLADRAEPWGMPTAAHGMIIPEDVMLITAGVDTQDDRVECVLIGFPIAGAPCILGHVAFAGNTLEDGVWKNLDAFLKTKWRHPNGWMLGIDGTAIDSGGREGRTQKVYDYCYPRMSRYIFAIKGLPGPRKVWTKLTSVKGDMRAFGVAVDVMKTEVLDRLAREPFNADGTANPQAFRLSDQLSEEFFEQVTNETRRVRFVKNRPIIEFQPKKAGAPTEGLDCFDAETDVLTDRGWLRFSSLDRTEKIATVNLATDLIEYQFPTAYIDREYSGPMVQIKATRLDILATPNHRMIVTRRSLKTTTAIVLASKLTVDHALKNTATWCGELSTVTVPPFIKKQRSCKIEGEPKYKVYGERAIRRSDFDVEWTKAAYVDRIDMAAFVGWYLSEGSRRKDKHKSQPNSIKTRVVITQNEGAKSDQIRSLLNRLPWNFSEIRGTAGTIHFTATSAQLHGFLDDCGDGYAGKRIPKWILQSAPEVIESCFGAMVAGDGWTCKKEHRTVCTVSKGMADDIQEMLIKMGRSSTIKTRTVEQLNSNGGSVILGRAVFAKRDQYHVNEIRTRAAWLRTSRCEPIVSAVEYAGTVHCVNVPNGTLICRRNGKTFIAGNCVVYALAVRQSPSIHSIDMREREARRGVLTDRPTKPRAGGWAEQFAEL